MQQTLYATSIIYSLMQQTVDDIYKNIADCGTFQLIFRGKTFMILLNKWKTDRSRLKAHKLSRLFP
jgi:hypothetical protein